MALSCACAFGAWDMRLQVTQPRVMSAAFDLGEPAAGEVEERDADEPREVDDGEAEAGLGGWTRGMCAVEPVGAAPG